MKISLDFIIFLGFTVLSEIKSDNGDVDEKILKINVNNDLIDLQKHDGPIQEGNIDNYNEENEKIFDIQWMGNGDFRKKKSNNRSLGESTLENEINFNNTRKKIEESDLLSIHNMKIASIKNISPEKTSIKSINTIDNDEKHGETFERSFTIDDPSRELKSLDSLRSVIINQHETNNSQSSHDYNINNHKIKSIDKKLIDENRDNVMRSHSILMKTNTRNNKPFYWNRGNRKYQHAVNYDEEILVRDVTSSYPTDNKHKWKKIRPANRIDNYRSSENSNTRDQTIPTDDYQNYEFPYNRLPHSSIRLLCQTNSNVHMYLANRESQCHMFYICFHGDIVPMICPSGTLFNENLQVCDWTYNVEC